MSGLILLLLALTGVNTGLLLALFFSHRDTACGAAAPALPEREDGPRLDESFENLMRYQVERPTPEGGEHT